MHAILNRHTRLFPAETYSTTIIGARDHEFISTRFKRLSNGADIALNLAATTTVKFYYDDQTHWVTDNIKSVIATAAGISKASLVAPAIGTPVASARGCRTQMAMESIDSPHDYLAGGQL